jgi:hypothetical protein
VQEVQLIIWRIFCKAAEALEAQAKNVTNRP